MVAHPPVARVALRAGAVVRLGTVVVILSSETLKDEALYKADGVAWLCEAAQATMLRWLVTPLFSMAKPSPALVTRPSTTATHMVATLLGSLCCVEWCHVQSEYIIKIIANMSLMFEDIVPTTLREGRQAPSYIV